MIPVFISAIVCTFATKLLREETSRLKTMMLQNVANEVDNQFSKIEELVQQIIMNYDIQAFCKVQKPFTSKTRYDRLEVIRSLKAYRSGDDNIIDDLYIYYPLSGYIISPKAGYDEEFFFNNVCNYLHFSSIDEMRQFHTENYIMAYDYELNEVIKKDVFEKEYILLLQSLNVWTSGKGTLVIQIDRKKLLEMLTKNIDEGQVAILSMEGEVLASNGWEQDVYTHLGPSLLSNTGRQTVTVNNEKYLLTNVTGKSGNFRYYYSESEKKFQHKVIRIRNITFFATLFTLFFGMSITFIRSSKISDGINKMIDSINVFSGKEKSKNEDELGYICRMVTDSFQRNLSLKKEYEKLLLENKQYSQQIANNYAMVQNSLLMRIIEGNLNEYTNAHHLYSDYNIEFPHPFFTTMLIVFDEIENQKEHKTEKKRQIIGFVLKSLVKDVFDKKESVVYCINTDRKEFVLLVNYHEESKTSLSSLKVLAKKIGDYSFENFELSVTIGISEMRDSIHDIHHCYVQSIRAADYRIVRGYGAVIQYREIQNQQKNYFYPIESELKLINCVRNGDFERCSVIVEDIFRKNFEDTNPDILITRCLFFDIMSTGLKVLDSINAPPAEIFGDECNPIEKLSDCKTIHDMRKVILGIYKDVCCYVNGKKDRNDKVLMDQILTFINENYSDVCFSQNMVAERFNLSQSFLSSFFKQRMGINMTDYIQKMRIEDACTLLKQSSLHQTEIAKRVGYASDKTLIRVFKQLQGVTPGHYRELHFIQNEG
jgi:AraC-like DNA-binding protein